VGNLVLDASSPTIAYIGATSTTTTASFTPPANSRLLAMSALNTGAGNQPGPPTITGGGLTWTLLQHNKLPDVTLSVDGQVAVWTAVVTTSAAMTVAVTNTDPATGQSVKVQVWTDDSGGVPGIGATKENARAGAGTAVTDSVTATANGSRGVLAYTDWNGTATVPTAGTGCTMTGGGGQVQSGIITYAYLLRAANDGVTGSPITMNLTTGNTAHNRWVIVEVTPATTPAVTSAGDGYVSPDFWPGDGPAQSERFWQDPAAAPPATISKLNTFDGQTAGTTITAGNSTTSGDALSFVGVPTGGSATYVAGSFRGTGAARLVIAGTAGLVYLEQTAGISSTGQWYGRLRFRLPVALPPDATGYRFMILADSAGAFQVDGRIINTGALELRSGAGTLIGTTTKTYAVGEWVDVGLAIGSFSATAGVIAMDVYDVDAVTVLERISSAPTVDTLRSGGANKAQVGIVTSGRTNVTIDVDDFAQSTLGYPVLPPADSTPATNATAEQAPTGYAGYDAAASIGVNAEQAAAAWLAYDASAAAGVNAEPVTVAWSAFDAGVALTATAEQAATGYAALDASAAVGPVADVASVGWNAYDATVSTATVSTVPAEVAPTGYTAYDASVSTSAAVGTDPGALAFTAYDASVSTSVAATVGQATIGFTAYDATVSTASNITATAEAATAAYTAGDASVAVAFAAGQAALGFTAADASAAITFTAEAAPVVFTAYDATVSTLSQTSVDAEAASTGYTALDPAAAIGVPAGQGSAAWSAYDASTAAGVQPGQAPISWLALDASVSAAFPAGQAAAAWSALDASAAVSPFADVAVVAFTAYDASVSTLALTNAPAEAAAVTFAAYDAAVSTSVLVVADVALIGFSALDAAGSIGIPGSQAGTAYAALDAAVSTGTATGAGQGALTFVALDASARITLNAEAAAVGYAALDATVVTVSQIRAFRDADSRTVVTGERGSTGRASTADGRGQMTTTVHSGGGTITGERGSRGTITGGQG